ncbi:MAG: TetR family transcriptional regulator C-terminal domain-containing protein [Ruminococcus sp.]|nr:TetR family transcriptional regulator C-terminal domain-containing protein [Ruminococcus sp.]
MAEQKIDNRIKRTKRLLKQGVTKLILQKSIKKISVRELTDLVEINRGTFYLHYKDIYDLVEQIENELCEEFDEVLVKSLAESNGDELKVFRDFCYFLDENRDICYALLSDNGDINFLLKMRAIISRRCFSNVPKDYIKSYGKNDYIYIISYFESGTVGILRYWLSDESDSRKSSEEIALILKTLFMEGLNGMTNK